MSVPTEIAQQLSDEVVGAILLVDLDTTGGHIRLLPGEDGIFTDTNGDQWLGSTLISLGDAQGGASNGSAPTFQVTLNYAYDPSRGTDLLAAVRQYGVDAINGRALTLYFQYFGKHEEMYAPIWSPIRVATYTMRQLIYGLDGDQTRNVAVSCEGPYPLRSKPPNGRYTDADQRRRENGDPSLEFMPTNAFDNQPLFGL